MSRDLPLNFLSFLMVFCAFAANDARSQIQVIPFPSNVPMIRAAAPAPTPPPVPPVPAPAAAPASAPAPSPLSPFQAVPEVLRPWQDWVTWEDRLFGAPPVYSDAKDRMPLWPGRLELSANGTGGRFALAVKVYAPAWMTLPGGPDAWPQGVQVDAKPAVVVERDGHPAVKLQPGPRRITGEIPWKEVPQGISLPAQIGVLDLSMNGEAVELPNWDEKGFLWLKRSPATEKAERNFLSAQVYRVLEDGIPLWLRTQIELSVSGKSREEELGHALPEGWKVAVVDSPLPCAVDDAGFVKVQVRAGKWTIRLDAFRIRPAEAVSYAKSAKPVTSEELVGFRARPDHRVVELGDIEAIDVSQTTYPEEWRSLPVYRWLTNSSFRMLEKMRGMGFQKPSGLSVERELWLDDGGALMTFRDRIRGTSQQSWRLDISPGQTLGAARMGGQGQLVTRNPASGANGIEVRQRNIDLEAVGRIENAQKFPASGWQADVERCEATLHLPPGWRVLAMFGVEWVAGDWLTAWTLLDLFLLLVLAMAVWKLWGPLQALVAILGFGLTYHEPDAPKWLWFFLLIPVAILRVIPPSRARTAVEVWRVIAVASLLVSLVPFAGRQLQGVLFPQLEPVREAGLPFVAAPLAGASDAVERVGKYVEEAEMLSRASMAPQEGKTAAPQQTANLAYDPQARIQTGPAIPSWSWREVRFGWGQPVTPGESVQVVFIPPLMQRGITLLRVFLLILLAAILLNARRILPPFLRRRRPQPPPLPPGLSPTAPLIALLLLPWLLGGPEARAQGFPPQQMLEKLRERLLEPADAFPHAADIPSVVLRLDGHTLVTEAEVHAAAQVAVPLPGRLPAWSPVSVMVDGQRAEAVGRRDGFLWVVLPAGSHRVRLEGQLPNTTEWEWSFLLAPRRVSIEAPGWTVSGVKPNGVPERQILFTVQAPAVEAKAAYDRKDFTPALELERTIEMGLIWQVRTTLRRLSAGGKAVAMSIPLLPGESVLSAQFTVTGGSVEARLGASEKEVTWESQLGLRQALSLTAVEKERFVERWRLIASPVWNVQFTGLAPIYEAGSQGLEPVWRPWPGEQIELKMTRPEAIPGATMTVRRVEHTTELGSRQRTGRLQMELKASLGQEFALELDPNAEVTSLQIREGQNSEPIRQPVRRDGSKVIIPVRPGEQTMSLEWKAQERLGRIVRVDPVALPVESSNISTTLSLPEDRWVLWTSGPLRGPAVRLWVVAALAVLGAFVLGRLRLTPLHGMEWALLGLGLTQVHPGPALIVVGWLFLLAWRGTDRGTALRPLAFNLLQVVLILGAIPVVTTLLAALHRGLLGTPEMMVLGNGSSPTSLRWFAQQASGSLPRPEVISVSIWFYRLLMLAWALWLAVAALRWVRWGWTQLTRESLFKGGKKPVVLP